MIYLDTSWLVKLYVEEDDSDGVRALVAADPTVAVSDLCFVEMHSAVARRRREGKMAARVASAVLGRFRREWTDRHRVAVSAEVIARAADLVAAHPLRSLDAVRLASALLVAEGAPEPVRFGAGDKNLIAAARSEGLLALSGE